jgi:DNA (cytosine-5)-methyltransferase 1
MTPLTVGSLFSGIGGFEFGLERTGGFKTVWQCEIDPFCLKVLEKHWPGVKRFADIKKMGVEEEIPHVDVVCGGFPCQPVSCAGKRKGKEDERWLWPEFCRVVCCVRPEWVLIENVPGLLSADAGRLFAGILRDLSESGYDAEWNIVSAASVGAPHLRKRVFIVAHTSQPGRQQITRSTHGDEAEDERRTTKENNEPERDGESGGTGYVADSDSILSKSIFGNMGRIKAVVEAEQGIPQPGSFGETPREIADTESVRRGRRTMLSKTPQPRRGFRSERDHSWSIEPDVGRVANGVPARVDRLRALGNAIVPQCAQFVGWCLLDSIRTEAAQ